MWPSSLFHFGINWAGLFYASWLLLWLSIAASALYVILMSALNFAVTLKLPLGWSSSQKTSRIYVSAQKAKRQVNRWMPSAALFIVGYVLGQASIFSPIRELHAVEVLSKDAERVYTVNIPYSMNPPNKRDIVTPLRLCPEGDDLPLKKGMVIEPLQYIQQKDCILINKDTYVDWLRDKDKNVVDKHGKILFAKEEE